MIRQEGEFIDLPIIALTAHAMNENKVKCLEYGMNDFVVKPVNPKHLLSCY